MSATPEIDYELLSTMVAEKLRAQSVAYVQGRSTLEDEWLLDTFLKFIEYNAPFISRRIIATNDYNETFKVKLKSLLNTIY